MLDIPYLIQNSHKENGRVFFGCERSKLIFPEEDFPAACEAFRKLPPDESDKVFDNLMEIIHGRERVTISLVSQQNDFSSPSGRYFTCQITDPQSLSKKVAEAADFVRNGTDEREATTMMRTPVLLLSLPNRKNTVVTER